MPTAKENETQAREAYAAFAAGDLDKVKAVFHPDIVWVFRNECGFGHPTR